MTCSPARRFLALFLCAQPAFWMNGVALAQTVQRPFGPQAGRAQPTDPLTGRDQSEPPEEPMELGRDGPRPEAPATPPLTSVPATGGTTAIDEPVDPEKYVCGHGDVFELNFWGLQNLSQRVMIDLEGRVFLPRVGHLELQGKTLAEARKLIQGAIARYYPRLSFDVTLAQPRTFLVQVADAVKKPGSYPARAIDRVAGIVERAGGFARNASQRRVEVRHRDGTAIVADLLAYKLTGDVKFNPYLLDGDVVRVPFEGLVATIGGAVNRPGRYELTGTRDIAELVSLAGGLSPTATRQLPISVVRRLGDDKQQQQLIEFPGEGLPVVPLGGEDAVRIPDFTELQQSVMVVGAITGVQPPSGAGGVAPDEASATRRLPFVSGDSVRTLLERVGGVGPLADLSGAYLLRNGKALSVDLRAMIMLRDLKADRPVELGDTLVIPFKRSNILVQGAVFTPGSYPYNPLFGVEQYLALAGGRNRFAQSLSDVRIVTPNGETKSNSRGLVVEPGSSLVVPERNFSRAEIVQIALGIASVLVSGVAVVLAAR